MHSTIRLPGSIRRQVTLVVVDLIGVVLAAGTRSGVPAGLTRGPDGTPWVVGAARVLRDAGCSRIGVVVGASAPDVVGLLTDEDVTIVPSPNRSDSVSLSVRTGLTWATESKAPLAVFHMVDLPNVGTSVVRRVLAEAIEAPSYSDQPAEPSYDEAPGHDPSERLVARASYQGAASYPVVIGRAHWPGALASATDGRLMGPYLKRVPCPLIPCDDLVSL